MGSRPPPRDSAAPVTMLQTLAVLALAAMSSVSAYSTEDLSLYEEEASDPRLFFANYTSGLLAVNTTLLLYAGIIVAAGIVVGLVLYFIATNPQSSRYYNSNSYSNSQYYSQARMLHDAGFLSEDWNLMGLITKALDIYSRLNQEEHDQ